MFILKNHNWDIFCSKLSVLRRFWNERFWRNKKKTQKEIDKSKKNSKKLADLALKSQINGNIAEAIRYYEEFINKGFQNDVVFTNYGALLDQLGKFNKA